MRPAPDAQPGPKLSHALALGALHGPAELMPVSSSAHTTLVPWLANATSSGTQRDPLRRKLRR